MLIKVVRYLPKAEAAIHGCLRPLTEKSFFMSIFLSIFLNKVIGLQPKKRLLYRCFPVTFAYFCQMPYSLLGRPHQQNVALDLLMFGLYLNSFKANTVSR